MSIVVYGRGPMSQVDRPALLCWHECARSEGHSRWWVRAV